MKVFYGCEFLEDGRVIELISIGLVAEDGREYYAVNSEMPVARIERHQWLMENVAPSLPLRQRVKPSNLAVPALVLDMSSTLVRPRWVIANEVREFLLAAPPPELWTWYGAYDHVCLCQLWGAMAKLPPGIPMHTLDLQQEIIMLGSPEVPAQAGGVHNALEDARHARDVYLFLQEDTWHESTSTGSTSSTRLGRRRKAGSPQAGSQRPTPTAP